MMDRAQVVAEIFALIKKHEPGFEGDHDEFLAFAEAGIDSVVTVDIVVNVERTCGVEIPDEVLGDLRSVGDLADYVMSNVEGVGDRSA
jgi:acyl carrier protein